MSEMWNVHWQPHENQGHQHVQMSLNSETDACIYFHELVTENLQPIHKASKFHISTLYFASWTSAVQIAPFFHVKGKISDIISKTSLLVSLLQRKIPPLCKTGRIELLLIDIFLSGKYQISKIDTNQPTKPILTSNCVKRNFKATLLATSWY